MYGYNVYCEFNIIKRVVVIYEMFFFFKQCIVLSFFFYGRRVIFLDLDLFCSYGSEYFNEVGCSWLNVCGIIILWRGFNMFYNIRYGWNQIIGRFIYLFYGLCYNYRYESFW